MKQLVKPFFAFIIIASLIAFLYARSFSYFDFEEVRFKLKQDVVSVISVPYAKITFEDTKKFASNYAKENGFKYREFNVGLVEQNHELIRLKRGSVVIIINDVSSLENFARYDIAFQNVSWETAANRLQVKLVADEFINYMQKEKIVKIQQYIYRQKSNSEAIKKL